MAYKVKLGADNVGIRSSITEVPFYNRSDIKTATINIEKVGGIDADSPNQNSSDVKTGFTNNISFYGAEAKYLSDVLISHAEARANYVKIEIWEDCCSVENGGLQLFRGVIKYNGIDWSSKNGSIDDCFNCHVDITAESDDVIAGHYKCIQDNLIKDPCKDSNGNKIPCANSFTGNKHFQNYGGHPFVQYCSCRSDVSGYIASFLLAPMYLVLVTLSPIIFIINLILVPVNWVKVHLLGQDPIDGLPEDMGWTGDFLNSLKNLMVPCNKGHIAPFVRDFIKNVCDKCGLTFQSTILNDATSAYYNLVLFSPTGDNGDFNAADNRKDYWAKSVPTYNLVKLLNELGRVFNSKWWIANNVLKFEHTANSPNVWVDFSTPNTEFRITDLDFKWGKKTLPAAATFDYMEDGIDETANLNLREYRETVNYHYDLNGNFHVAPQLEGVKEYRFNYGAVRGWRDGLGKCVLFSTAYQIYINIATLGALSGEFASAEKGKLIMSGDKTTIPKLLIVRPDDTGKMVRKDHPNKDDEFVYNYPMYISDGREDIGIDKINFTPAECLYKFFEKDHPLNNLTDVMDGIEFTLKVTYDCGILNSLMASLQLYGFDLYVMLPYCGVSRKGQVEKIEITEGYLTINGII